MYYFLDIDERTPRKCTYDEWMIFQDSPSHLIAEDYTNSIKIETRFCGLEPFYVEGLQPFLYETIVYNGVYQGEEMKFCTFEEAIEGHSQICQIIKNTYNIGLG